jgi:hypothetical protein
VLRFDRPLPKGGSRRASSTRDCSTCA